MPKYDNNFFDAEDLVECLSRGCEVEFIYNQKKYSITHTAEGEVAVIEFYNEGSERTYSDGWQALEYEVGDKKLKDVISEMKITDRSF